MSEEGGTSETVSSFASSLALGVGKLFIGTVAEDVAAVASAAGTLRFLGKDNTSLRQNLSSFFVFSIPGYLINVTDRRIASRLASMLVT